MELKVIDRVNSDGIRTFSLVCDNEKSDESQKEMVFNLIHDAMIELNLKVVAQGIKDCFEGFVVEYENALLVNDQWGTRFASSNEELIKQVKSIVDVKLKSGPT